MQRVCGLIEKRPQSKAWAGLGLWLEDLLAGSHWFAPQPNPKQPCYTTREKNGAIRSH